MSNPAAALFELLSRWQPEDSQRVLDIRGMDDEESTDQGIKAIHAALNHIQAIEEALDALDKESARVGHYRRHLPKWRRWVLAIPSGWSGAGRHWYMRDEDSLDVLESLADRLDHFIPIADENTVAMCRRFADEVRDLVAEDLSLPLQLRRHLHMLLSHIYQILDEYDLFGSFELREATDRLTVAVRAAQATSKNKNQWDDLMERFTWPFLTNLAVEGVKHVMPELEA